MTNREFAKEASFIKLCEEVSEKLGQTIKATRRQASKFRRGFGIVRTNKD